MQLSNEQRDQLEREGIVPIVIEGIPCVLVRADLFDRLKPAAWTPPAHDAWVAPDEGIDVDDYVT